MSDSERRQSKSSILKPPKQRMPLQSVDSLEVNTGKNEKDDFVTAAAQAASLRRRVSFAGVNIVKEFHSSAECFSVCQAPTYEEPLTLSSDSSGHSRNSEASSISISSNETGILKDDDSDPMDSMMKSYMGTSIRQTSHQDRKLRFSLGLAPSSDDGDSAPLLGGNDQDKHSVSSIETQPAATSCQDQAKEYSGNSNFYFGPKSMEELNQNHNLSRASGDLPEISNRDMNRSARQHPYVHPQKEFNGNIEEIGHNIFNTTCTTSCDMEFTNPQIKRSINTVGVPFSVTNPVVDYKRAGSQESDVFGRTDDPGFAYPRLQSSPNNTSRIERGVLNKTCDTVCDMEFTEVAPSGLVQDDMGLIAKEALPIAVDLSQPAQNSQPLQTEVPINISPYLAFMRDGSIASTDSTVGSVFVPVDHPRFANPLLRRQNENAPKVGQEVLNTTRNSECDMEFTEVVPASVVRNTMSNEALRAPERVNPIPLCDMELQQYDEGKKLPQNENSTYAPVSQGSDFAMTVKNTLQITSHKENFDRDNIELLHSNEVRRTEQQDRIYSLLENAPFEAEDYRNSSTFIKTSTIPQEKETSNQESSLRNVQRKAGELAHNREAVSQSDENTVQAISVDLTQSTQNSQPLQTEVPTNISPYLAYMRDGSVSSADSTVDSFFVTVDHPRFANPLFRRQNENAPKVGQEVLNSTRNSECDMEFTEVVPAGVVQNIMRNEALSAPIHVSPSSDMELQQYEENEKAPFGAEDYRDISTITKTATIPQPRDASNQGISLRNVQGKAGELAQNREAVLQSDEKQLYLNENTEQAISVDLPQSAQNSQPLQTEVPIKISPYLAYMRDGSVSSTDSTVDSVFVTVDHPRFANPLFRRQNENAPKVGQGVLSTTLQTECDMEFTEVVPAGVVQNKVSNEALSAPEHVNPIPSSDVEFQQYEGGEKIPNPNAESPGIEMPDEETLVPSKDEETIVPSESMESISLVPSLASGVNEVASADVAQDIIGLKNNVALGTGLSARAETAKIGKKEAHSRMGGDTSLLSSQTVSSNLPLSVMSEEVAHQSNQSSNLAPINIPANTEPPKTVTKLITEHILEFKIKRPQSSDFEFESINEREWSIRFPCTVLELRTNLMLVPTQIRVKSSGGRFIYGTNDSTHPNLKIGMKMLENLFSCEGVRQLITLEKNFFTVLREIGKLVSRVKLFLAVLKICEEKHSLTVNENWVTFPIASGICHFLFNVKLNILNLGHLTPSDVIVETIIGNVNEGAVKQLISGCEQTPLFLKDFIEYVKQYIEALESFKSS